MNASVAKTGDKKMYRRAFISYVFKRVPESRWGTSCNFVQTKKPGNTTQIPWWITFDCC